MDRQIKPRRPKRQGARLQQAIAEHRGMVYINNVITEYHGAEKTRANHITDRREPWLSRYNTVTKAVANAPTIQSRAIADQTHLQHRHHGPSRIEMSTQHIRQGMSQAVLNTNTSNHLLFKTRIISSRAGGSRTARFNARAAMTRTGIIIIRNINASCLGEIDHICIYMCIIVNIAKLLAGRGGSLKCMRTLSKHVLHVEHD